ncbi:MAG: ATP-binding protein [Actinomycetota bacterium]
MKLPKYERAHLRTVMRRIREPRRLIQVLSGPRQVGKTTLALQALNAIDLPGHYASADDPGVESLAWLETQWESARALAADNRRGAVLVLDEIQKVGGWSETVKRLWDGDARDEVPLRVVLLGSSPLLVQRGVSESLAGRFEVISVPHWSFTEMREAFGWEVDRFVYFGGYPGAAPLVGDEERWRRYVLDSLVETTLARDVLLITRIDKPALLRRLFEMACQYSGQIVSFQSMVGQLADAGNTTTLAHYLEVLGEAGMVVGLPKYSGSIVRRRASSPKLQVLNTALMSAFLGADFATTRADHTTWGRLVESAVGAHLLNSSRGSRTGVYYWRDRDREVDFVLEDGASRVPIEVTSAARKNTRPGMDAFERAHGPVRRRLLIGAHGMGLSEFLERPAAYWLR